MALRIEDYALIGDTHSAALVGRDGSIDWLCLPCFNADACFAALLGDARHGRWLLAPEGGGLAARRRYRPGTLVLETTFATEDGEVRVVDCMPRREDDPNLVRVVEGVRGEVPMQMILTPRFGYGAILPWVRRLDGRHGAVAGPDALVLCADAAVSLDDASLRSRFRVHAGQRVAFLLTWHPSHLPPPPPIDARAAVDETEAYWAAWSRRCSYGGPHRDAVVRSLITLEALTYAPTGGIVAAPTTSLPERLGGSRNWDYRYCWLRDATFTLLALLGGGYAEEAEAFRAFLLRAVAGAPADLQIMYGIRGERRIDEREAPWLPGYEGSCPVRLGNAAVKQFQLDVYGEILDASYQGRRHGLAADPAFWGLERGLLEFVEGVWHRPDSGIWEMRGPPRHFTYSKVMAWAAMDRAVRTIEELGQPGPADRFRRARAEIHAEVCRRGFDAERNTFVQAYGAQELDASLLLLPLVGFLPATDPRVRGTVAAIQRDLTADGLVRRYRSEAGLDGVGGGEGVFLACSFWLADNLCLQGRVDEARALFQRLLDLRNDVGLLSEEYSPRARRLVGNFPQAFSHVALVNTALTLERAVPVRAAA